MTWNGDAAAALDEATADGRDRGLSVSDLKDNIWQATSAEVAELVVECSACAGSGSLGPVRLVHTDIYDSNDQYVETTGSHEVGGECATCFGTGRVLRLPSAIGELYFIAVMALRAVLESLPVVSAEHPRTDAVLDMVITLQRWSSEDRHSLERIVEVLGFLNVGSMAARDDALFEVRRELAQLRWGYPDL